MTTTRAREAGTTTAGRTAGIRPYAILIGLATLFVFLQSFTSGEFVNQKGDGAEAWTEVHGLLAYPVMLLPLAAAAVAFLRLRPIAPTLWVWTGALFVLSVVQWLLGHAISNLHLDWLIVVHVVNAFIVYGLAIWLSVRSALLRRSAAAAA
jgi:hypothetical protein